MNKFKVVIIDDEVLAIHHLKRLMNGEDHGFEIVGESTHPEKALALCDKLEPDVVFVDIRMPLMNGLEFSKKLLDRKRSVKIILLTSYKEFEYARDAVKIGVFDYLLKHELDADSLAIELSRIRTELENEKQQESFIRRQLLIDMLAGRKQTEQPLERVMQSIKFLGEQLLFLILQQDQPFPVLPYPLDTSPLPLLPSDLQHPAISIVEALPLEAGRCGVLLISKRIHGQRELEENLFAVCRSIQHAYKDQVNKSVSICASRPFAKLSALSDMVKEMEHALRNVQLLGRNHILHAHSLILQTDPVEEPATPSFASIETHLETGDHASLRASIEVLFQPFIKRFHPDPLKFICRGLIRILDKFRAHHHMPSLEKLMEEGRIQPDHWYSQREICDWFTGMFTATLDDVQRNLALSPNSKKIRQTLAYMHSHFAEDLTTESLSEKLGISGDHLRHVFKEETGQTILDALTTIRMQKAAELLTEGRYKIYEIAALVGYQSSQYFSHVFRKKMGLSPLDYIDNKGNAPHENKN